MKYYLVRRKFNSILKKFFTFISDVIYFLKVAKKINTNKLNCYVLIILNLILNFFYLYILYFESFIFIFFISSLKI
jgi:hypothetical protein